MSFEYVIIIVTRKHTHRTTVITRICIVSIERRGPSLLLLLKLLDVRTQHDTSVCKVCMQTYNLTRICVQCLRCCCTFICATEWQKCTYTHSQTNSTEQFNFRNRGNMNTQSICCLRMLEQVQAFIRTQTHSETLRGGRRGGPYFLLLVLVVVDAALLLLTVSVCD